MPSRPSSNTSVSDGDLPPPPKRVKVKTQHSPNTWVVIPSFANKICQLTCYVQNRLSLSKDEQYHMYLDGSLIPPEETIEVIRDGDEIHVYPAGKSGSPQENPSSNSTQSKPRRVLSAEGRRRRNARNRQREKRRRQEARNARAAASLSNSASITAEGSEQQLSITTQKPSEWQPQPSTDIKQRESKQEKVGKGVANSTRPEPHTANQTSRVIRTQNVPVTGYEKSWDTSNHQSENQTVGLPGGTVLKPVKNSRSTTNTGCRESRTTRITKHDLRPSDLKRNPCTPRKPFPALNQPKQGYVVATGKLTKQIKPIKAVTSCSSDAVRQMKSYAASLVEEVLEMVAEGSGKQTEKPVNADRTCQKRDKQQGTGAFASHGFLAKDATDDGRGAVLSTGILPEEVPKKTEGLEGNGGPVGLNEARLPSSISLSIAASEIHLAQELNPVAYDQHFPPGDLNAAIDDILKVLNCGKIGNASPTAIVNTVIEENNYDESANTRNNGRILKQLPAKGEITREQRADFGAVGTFQLKVDESRKPLWSSRGKADCKSSARLHSEKEGIEGAPSKRQKLAHVVSETVQMHRPKASDTEQIPGFAHGLPSEVSGLDGTPGLKNFISARDVWSSISKPKRRRVDIDYTFSGLETRTGLLIPSVEGSRPKKPGLKAGIDGKSDPNHTDTQSKNEIKSRFLDDILDLEKVFDIKLPELGHSQTPLSDQERPSKELRLVHIRSDREDNPKRVELACTSREGNETFDNSEEVNKKGSVQPGNPKQDEILIRMKARAVSDVIGRTQSDKELVREAAITATKPLSTARNQPTTSDSGKRSNTEKRRGGTLSVSAALRFARKQKMLQGPALDKELFDHDAIVQDPLPSIPKSKKRKKKKKKRMSAPDEKQMISETQHNESVLLGFEKESEHCETLPPLSLLESPVDMRDPSLFISTKTNVAGPKIGVNQLCSLGQAVERQRRSKETEVFALEGQTELGVEDKLLKDDLLEESKTASSGTKHFEGKDIIHDRSRFSMNEGREVSRGANDDLTIDKVPTADDVSAKDIQEDEDESCEHLPPTPLVMETEEAFEHNDNIATSTLGGLKQPLVDPRNKKNDRVQREVIESKTKTMLDKSSRREHILPDLKSEVSEGKGGGKHAFRGKQPRHIIDRHQDCVTSNREGQEAGSDFDEKRRFFDDVATLMIDTTVELEFFCRELFRTSSKSEDDCPS
eukprot:TRINITY_DN3318_c0_g1_i1.p1 TRINITY_DN3318_c0_g1~~TRINITY_DN3318_c0_g1_i1.p1  ORF type:complete len:1210 (+),score=191.92 TRINITY_DN3318_c0_g1_i1:273-3902(+)